MKKNLLIMAAFLLSMASCTKQAAPTQEFTYNVDKFYDLEVLRYKVPGFEQLSLQEKQLIYYLSEAALQGRDIIYDQNGRYNLRIRRALEALYVNYKGDKESRDFLAMEKYLKRVWFSDGIYHHYNEDKFHPEFSQEWFVQALQETGIEYNPEILPVMFDPMVLPRRTARPGSRDMVLQSAGNYYGPDVTQAEAEKWYADHKDNSEEPLWVGLNAQLAKDKYGQLYERTYRVGGMYSPALEKVVYWLEKALTVAENDQQRKTIELLIELNRTGDLQKYNEYCIAWVQDVDSRVDHVNGFTETYNDPLGMTGAWEALVNFKDLEATHRTQIMSDNAQWFEDNSPTDIKYKKEAVKGVSAKVITAAMLGGDCYPASPIGINLPNASWIRKEYGSKSVSIDNLSHAYADAAKGNGFNEEFMFSNVETKMAEDYGVMCSDLHTDLHECIGHGSGKLLPGVDKNSLREYASIIEETRADLFGYYYMADPKLVELGLLPNQEAYKAFYYQQMMNGLLTQLIRIPRGKEISEVHMINRQIIALWAFQNAQNKELEVINRSGKLYVRINNYEGLRQLFGQLLREVQRITSTGDYEAARDLVETYGIKVNSEWHDNILSRYDLLNLAPYKGFVNPVYTLVYDDNGDIQDVRIDLTEGYVEQNLRYSRDYSTLPDVN